MRPSRLIVEGVAVSRGGRRLVEDLSFIVRAGEAVVLTGPNGVGKTTLLRAIAGFISLDTGEVRLEGGADGESTVGEQAHFVGHLNATKSALTVRQGLEFWARFLGGDPRDVPNILERLDLDTLGHVPAGYLSAGQRRRLALARLLVVERPLWLLDEPTVSLDEHAREVLAEIMNAHLAGGGLLVAATHLPLGLKPARELVMVPAQAGVGAE